MVSRDDNFAFTFGAQTASPSVSPAYKRTSDAESAHADIGRIVSVGSSPRLSTHGESGPEVEELADGEEPIDLEVVQPDELEEFDNDMNNDTSETEDSASDTAGSAVTSRLRRLSTKETGLPATRRGNNRQITNSQTVPGQKRSHREIMDSDQTDEWQPNEEEVNDHDGARRLRRRIRSPYPELASSLPSDDSVSSDDHRQPSTDFRRGLSDLHVRAPRPDSSSESHAPLYRKVSESAMDVDPAAS